MAEAREPWYTRAAPPNRERLVAALAGGGLHLHWVHYGHSSPFWREMLKPTRDCNTLACFKLKVKNLRPE